MLSSCTLHAHTVRFMDVSRQDQIAWVRAVLGHLGVTATELARRAKIAPSTLHRPLNDPNWPGMLSGRVLTAIAKEAGVKPLEFPSGSRGFSEPEIEPFVYGDGNAVGGISSAVRDMCQGRNGRDAWIMKSYALELVGILPGDVLIVDLNMQARANDIVCAQLYDFTHSRAETVMRVFQPPYLVTQSLRLGPQKPVAVDGDSVVIKGVVDGMIRPGRQLAAA